MEESNDLLKKYLKRISKTDAQPKTIFDRPPGGFLTFVLVLVSVVC